MAKQKKNSNYVTDKNISKKEALEEQKRKEQTMKNFKPVAIIAGSVIGVVVILLVVLYACGVFNYYPEATLDANIVFNDGTSLHFELYGNDAPKTVNHFKTLASNGYFRNKEAHTFLNGLLYFGDLNADGDKKGIDGEFDANGFKNKIKMEEGVICLARGEDNDSGYGQFFILTKDSPKLKGDYAAFGKITNPEALEKLIDSIQVDKNGNVIKAPVISYIEVHAPHGH